MSTTDRGIELSTKGDILVFFMSMAYYEVYFVSDLFRVLLLGRFFVG
jgi:hypothetical protein